MSTVKFGIVGIGNMGSAHTQNVSVIPNSKLGAVCDINPEAFKRIYAPVRDTVPKYTDVDTFLREADIDVVVVAVPHYFHPEIAIKALRAGKHIVVEKPIAVHKAAAEELLAEAAKYPALLKSLMFNQRTTAAHRRIKGLIDSGELGKIHRVCWTITDWFRSQAYYDSGDWRASWRGEGGGVLLNQCPHQLDLMQWFFGMPNKVRASVKLGKWHDIEVEDEVNAYLEYPDGKVANFISSTGEMPGTNRLEIAADRGRLVYEDGKLEFIRNEIETTKFIKETKNIWGTSPKWKCEIPIPSEGGLTQHQAILDSVVKAVLDGAPLIAPMEEGIRGLELGNAIELSGLKNKEVILPLDSAEYAEMLDGLVKTSRYVKKAPATPANNDGFNASFGTK